MPEKEPNSYPSCNRAFALRMMNPTSYADEQVSIFDRKIQPVVKKPIAKNVGDIQETLSASQNDFVSPLVAKNLSDFNRQVSLDLISIDEGTSLSPSLSSDTTFSEMELYDIDELESENDINIIRQHSSLDNYSKNQKGKNKNCRLLEDSEFMYRSHSSAEGFDRYFSRNSNTRATTPCRIKSENNKDVKKPLRAEASTFLKEKSQSNTSGSSLKRSHSLKNKKINSSSPQNPEKAREKPKTPSKIRVAPTKSSQLRAKRHDSNGVVYNSPSVTPITSKPSRSNHTIYSSRIHSHNNQNEEYSGSDSSIFSEIDYSTYPQHPLHSQQQQIRNRPSSSSMNNRTRESNGNSSSSSSQRKKSNKDIMASSFVFLSSYQRDTFSSRLSDLCQLISERHPGDFQILETLVEMQSSYEERNDLVKETISCLRERVKYLENKLSKTPNIPGMVIPLMRATNAFQAQLKSIMESEESPRADVSVQFPDVCSKGITMEEISAEANEVINKLEKLNINSINENENKVENNSVEYSHQQNGHVKEQGNQNFANVELNENIANGDMNILNGYTEASDSEESSLNVSRDNIYKSKHGQITSLTADAALTALNIENSIRY